VKQLDRKITDVKDIENLDFLGDKIKKKIKEIIETGKLRKTEILMQDE
jgi:DNA polymerase/3'-5' exonuclease PolX